MRKYNKIDRYGKKRVDLEKLKNIVIQEKIDGANASFKLENNEIVCFSRNNILSEDGDLRGFVKWVKDNVEKTLLVEGYIYYGEWAVKHKLDYGENHNKFYLFDIYMNNLGDYEIGEYAPLWTVKGEAERLGLEVAHVFYEGEFKSLEHVQEFVGQSILGEVGEGVVLKSYTDKDRFGNQIYMKFVSDEFAEKAKVKKHTYKDGCELDRFVDEFLTVARVQKMISKLVDEGLLEEDLEISDMGLILRTLGDSVYKDIIEEELDELLKSVKRKVGKKTPLLVKEALDF